MQIYKLPKKIDAFFFDIDGTLYTNDAYVQHQTDVLITELANQSGKTYQAVKTSIDQIKQKYAELHNGATTSLGNVMKELGVDIETSVKWRQKLIKPQNFLVHDTALKTALIQLLKTKYSSKQCVLLAVTNNPKSIGVASLEALGIRELFKHVIGLDDTMHSKPAPEPYLLAMTLASSKASTSISIGDRYDVDLSTPLKLGMGAVLVNGVRDVYTLPEVFNNFGIGS